MEEAMSFKEAVEAHGVGINDSASAGFSVRTGSHNCRPNFVIVDGEWIPRHDNGMSNIVEKELEMLRQSGAKVVAVWTASDGPGPVWAESHVFA